jgi:hypothetical protein
VSSRATGRFGAVRDPSMHGHSLPANRAREPGDVVTGRQSRAAGPRWGRVKPVASDERRREVRPRRSSNEVRERIRATGRGANGAKGNVGDRHGVRTQNRVVRYWGSTAHAKPHMKGKRKSSLPCLHHIDATVLRQAYHWLWTGRHGTPTKRTWTHGCATLKSASTGAPTGHSRAFVPSRHSATMSSNSGDAPCAGAARRIGRHGPTWTG